ncbi:hypothetical protein M407DRAFT_8627 [Tulasnella calospora MUT 4182]|uniref:Uncharacterized protein n=1 Tax=Tulasnella calospora MUT 4182 TaxID=1051891 RepID=A0A0C3QHA2_9AGAM|nr:hypothetical protein M407DRAFT_8627 [Tulasnella calospora MUT 4182]
MVWSICPFDNTIRALWQRDRSEFLLKSVISSLTGRIVFMSDVATYREAHPRNKYLEVIFLSSPLSLGSMRLTSSRCWPSVRKAYILAQAFKAENDNLGTEIHVNQAMYKFK